MKNRSFLVQLLLLLVFTMAISSAQAAERLDFWVSPDGEKSTMAISWYIAGKSTYILLPGNADPSQLKIGFSGADNVSIDGQPVHCGDSASLLVPGQEVVLSTSPDLGESVSVDSSIIVYYNTNIVVDEPQQSSNEDTGYDFN